MGVVRGLAGGGIDFSPIPRDCSPGTGPPSVGGRREGGPRSPTPNRLPFSARWTVELKFLRGCKTQSLCFVTLSGWPWLLSLLLLSTSPTRALGKSRPWWEKSQNASEGSQPPLLRGQVAVADPPSGSPLPSVQRPGPGWESPTCSCHRQVTSALRACISSSAKHPWWSRRCTRL